MPTRSFIAPILACLCCLCLGAAAATPWPQGTEGWRATAVPATPLAQTVFIPVPESLASCLGGKAVSADGQPLPTWPVRVDNRLVGAEVAVPAGGKPFCFYPARTAAPLPEAALRTPVVVQAWSAAMTTRPYEYIEMERFLGALPPLAEEGLASYGGIDAEACRQQPAKAVHWNNVHTDHNKQKAQIIHLSAYLRRDPGLANLRLAAANGEAPFFLYLDGEPVLKWRPNSRSGTVACPQPIDLPRPLVRLDFFTLVQAGEKFPVPLLYNAGAEKKKTSELKPELLVSAAMPASLAWESEAGDSAFAYDANQAALLLGHDSLKPALLIPGGVSAGSGPQAVKRQAFSGTMVLPQDLPAFPLPCAWQPPLRHRRDWPRLDLDAKPRIFAGTTLPLELRLTLPPTLENFRPCLRIRQEGLRPDGKAFAADQALPVPAGDGLREAGRREQPPGERPLASALVPTVIDAGAASSFRLLLAVDGVPLSPPLEMTILSPADDLSKLALVDGHLRCDGRLAVLKTDLQDPASSPPHPWIRKLLWYDEFWFNRRTPGADLVPDAAAAKRLAGKPGASMFASCRYQAADPEPEAPGTERLLQLGRLGDASVVVWSLDPGASASYEDVLQFSLTCRFLALACLAQDRLPVFITPAALPGKNPESMRLAALRLKELGVELGIPVVDFYSLYKLQAGQVPSLAAPYDSPTPGLLLPSANNAMRQWLLAQVAEALSQAL